MKSLIKAYALPLMVLFIAGGVYYLVFSRSVSFHTGDSAKLAQSTQTTPESTPTKDMQGAHIADSSSAQTSPKSPAQSQEPYQELAPESKETPADQAPDTLVDTFTRSPQTPADMQSQTPIDAAPATSIPAQDPIDLSSQAPQANQTAQPQNLHQEPQIEAMYYAKVANLNIRALPKSSGRILDKLALGQGVNVIEIQDDWAKLDSGGWVSLSLLTPTQPNQRPYIVLAKTLNIRALPESGSLVIGALYKDQRVQVAEIQDDWAKLDSGGWVSLRLIKAL
ncbi:SH3 domain-containing protein [uncultured Helicobacter sp.]|uniref:SH3 domain-containing protein n=1 Tax=uncultured Helicobacter sp. TaxID=175537 RepID=UPI00263867F0|nr:SH3 domain-containing protein [uncultured Helicobacter sp.]